MKKEKKKQKKIILFLFFSFFLSFLFFLCFFFLSFFFFLLPCFFFSFARAPLTPPTISLTIHVASPPLSVAPSSCFGKHLNLAALMHHTGLTPHFGYHPPFWPDFREVLLSFLLLLIFICYIEGNVSFRCEGRSVVVLVFSSFLVFRYFSFISNLLFVYLSFSLFLSF